MQKIRKVELAIRLSRAIRYNAGMAGLNIMIHGWLRHRKYGDKYRDKLYHRDWLFVSEVMDLSEYVGYDLRV